MLQLTLEIGKQHRCKPRPRWGVACSPFIKICPWQIWIKSREAFAQQWDKKSGEWEWEKKVIVNTGLYKVPVNLSLR